MANIISAITRNSPPGPKIANGDNDLYIVQLDGDPSVSGCKAPINTIAIFEGNIYKRA